MNLLDKLQVSTADVRRALEEKLSSGYSSVDIGTAARNVSALWESTLVQSGHPWTSNYLFTQTEDLTALGWMGGADLDVLRRTSNHAKHGNPVTASGRDILDALYRLELHVSSLRPLIPGLARSAQEPRLRQMVCAIYDYSAHGETEFTFIEATPSDTWRTARSVDGFQVDARNEALVREKLEKLSGWEYDPPAFAAVRASLLESDSELWRIAIFTAEYREAQEIVASYQHNAPLLRGLHRDDYAENVLATFGLIQVRKYAADRTVYTTADLLATALREGLVERRTDLLALAGAITALITTAWPHMTNLTLDRANERVFEDQLLRGPLSVDRACGVLVSPEGVLFVRTPR